MPLYMLFILGSGFSKSFAGLLVCRVLAAMFGARVSERRDMPFHPSPLTSPRPDSLTPTPHSLMFTPANLLVRPRISHTRNHNITCELCAFTLFPSSPSRMANDQTDTPTPTRLKRQSWHKRYGSTVTSYVGDLRKRFSMADQPSPMPDEHDKRNRRLSLAEGSLAKRDSLRDDLNQENIASAFPSYREWPLIKEEVDARASRTNVADQTGHADDHARAPSSFHISYSDEEVARLAGEIKDETIAEVHLNLFVFWLHERPENVRYVLTLDNLSLLRQ